MKGSSRKNCKSCRHRRPTRRLCGLNEGQFPKELHGVHPIRGDAGPVASMKGSSRKNCTWGSCSSRGGRRCCLNEGQFPKELHARRAVRATWTSLNEEQCLWLPPQPQDASMKGSSLKNCKQQLGSAITYARRPQ